MKKILINGSPRSGTTFVGVLIEEYTKELTIQEPLFIFNNLNQVFLKYKMSNIHDQIKDKLKIEKEVLLKNKEKFFEIFKNHYFFLKNHKYGYYFDSKGLKNFLLELKDYHIKEVRLHFYLNEDFIQKNWKVFHIIRNPADNYLSFSEKIIGQFKWRNTLLKLGEKHNFNFLNRYFLRFLNRQAYNNLLDLTNYFSVLKDYNNEKDLTKIINNIFKSPYYLFVWRWTLTNYHAINSIKSKNLLIFENKESYYKLFDNEDFIKVVNKNYKPMFYSEKRRKLLNKFLKISKDLDLEEEFKNICEIGGYI